MMTDSRSRPVQRGARQLPTSAVLICAALLTSLIGTLVSGAGQSKPQAAKSPVAQAPESRETARRGGSRDSSSRSDFCDLAGGECSALDPDNDARAGSAAQAPDGKAPSLSGVPLGPAHHDARRRDGGGRGFAAHGVEPGVLRDRPTARRPSSSFCDRGRQAALAIRDGPAGPSTPRRPGRRTTS